MLMMLKENVSETEVEVEVEVEAHGQERSCVTATGVIYLILACRAPASSDHHGCGYIHNDITSVYV
jgi:hypothetical protein